MGCNCRWVATWLQRSLSSKIDNIQKGERFSVSIRSFDMSFILKGWSMNYSLVVLESIHQHSYGKSIGSNPWCLQQQQQQHQHIINNNNNTNNNIKQSITFTLGKTGDEKHKNTSGQAKALWLVGGSGISLGLCCLWGGLTLGVLDGFRWFLLIFLDVSDQLWYKFPNVLLLIVWSGLKPGLKPSGIRFTKENLFWLSDRWQYPDCMPPGCAKTYQKHPKTTSGKVLGLVVFQNSRYIRHILNGPVQERRRLEPLRDVAARGVSKMGQSKGWTHRRIPSESSHATDQNHSSFPWFLKHWLIFVCYLCNQLFKNKTTNSLCGLRQVGDWSSCALKVWNKWRKVGFYMRSLGRMFSVGGK